MTPGVFLVILEGPSSSNSDPIAGPQSTYSNKLKVEIRQLLRCLMKAD